jgi:anaerobic selenocysteine-containing dehydrogenase
VGDLPLFWASFNNAPRRIQNGGWARQVTQYDFAISESIAGEAFAEDLRSTERDDILRVSGLMREQIERIAAIYIQAKAVIICYGTGITQHRTGAANVQQIANLLMLRGNFGKPGAGICPVRGHSNVQGDRTVGIDEKPSAELLDSIKRVFWLRSAACARPYRC